MRVTNAMMNSAVLYNTQAALSRLLKVQTQLSNGRRINQPSDDPLGTIRDLDYRSELAKNAQYQKNVSRGQQWQQSYDTVLADAKDLITQLREIAVTMANEVADDDGTSRTAAATEVKQIFEQLMQLGNHKLEDKYIFSGYRTDERALIASSNGVRYNGDYGSIKFEIDNSTDMPININGADTFLKQFSVLGENADLDVGVTGSTLLSNLHNGEGVDLAPGSFTIVDRNTGITANIFLGFCTTVEEAVNGINAYLTWFGIGNLTARIGDEGNNILMDTTQNGLISEVTSLDVINGGNGVDLSEGKIRLTDHDTIDVQIDFSGSETILDIIDNFNGQVQAAGIPNLSMRINAAGTGFEIVDNNGTPLGLSIEEIGYHSSVAANLGIDGQINPTLVGDDLNPTVSFEVIEGPGTTAADLGIVGEFFADFPGADLDPLLLESTNLADLNHGLGFELGEIKVCQGERTTFLDLGSPSIVTVQDVLDAFNTSGLDITASINPDGRGIQIVNNDPTRSFTIEDVANGSTAMDFGIYGSSDMMGSALALINALEADDQEAVGLLLGNFESAIDQLLYERSSVGSRSIRLESTTGRLVDQELTFTQRLSEVEDADITDLASRLAVYENNYQAALLATARIIQPSLLDFLR
ncbi:MAG: flagellar hook-associated protein FlgL [Candidatus Zixiibacteriota bacterium]